MTKKAMLIIMDGWGIGKISSSDAIKAAETPFIDSLYNKYPHSTLITYGEDVGLPKGQMGNSEVGHLNIGAGRIVNQELQRINIATKDNTLAQNSDLLSLINYSKDNNKKLHLIGLVSDGGVHSHINHLTSLLDICKTNDFFNVYIHAFTDGRDTDPKSGLHFLETILNHIKISTGTLATVTGRYYAMDRDNRWERVKLAYDVLVNNFGEKSNNILQTVKNYYENDITDEFLKPIICDEKGKIENDDAVLFFNFRTDRCREIVTVLTQESFDEFEMKPLNLKTATMTMYDASFKKVVALFNKENLQNTLGEILEKNNKSQARIAETEKYPHVTFFFSGGREAPFNNEVRIMKPSPKVATYDLQPQMSAHELKDATIDLLKTNPTDFIVINFANADMVGHTGVFNAVKIAAETVDKCVGEIVPLALEKKYTIFVTADHGNGDYMINEDGTPNTAHTVNLVPFVMINENATGKLNNGKLGDIAPTILSILDIDIPIEMTGKNLIIS